MHLKLYTIANQTEQDEHLCKRAQFVKCKADMYSSMLLTNITGELWAASDSRFI